MFDYEPQQYCRICNCEIDCYEICEDCSKEYDPFEAEDPYEKYGFDHKWKIERDMDL